MKKNNARGLGRNVHVYAVATCTYSDGVIEHEKGKKGTKGKEKRWSEGVAASGLCGPC